ncbi:MAG: hypothetical protein K1X79_03630 [Oligoflexia bacterium]|nr:hypothetical protein [Oligoflexia bacterium]
MKKAATGCYLSVTLTIIFTALLAPSNLSAENKTSDGCTPKEVKCDDNVSRRALSECAAYTVVRNGVQGKLTAYLIEKDGCPGNGDTGELELTFTPDGGQPTSLYSSSGGQKTFYFTNVSISAGSNISYSTFIQNTLDIDSNTRVRRNDNYVIKNCKCTSRNCAEDPALNDVSSSMIGDADSSLTAGNER